MYKKILVTLDGSEIGECVLEHLKTIAKGCDVPEVILLHVIEPLSAQSMTVLAQAGAETITRIEQEIQTDAENYMSKVTNNIKNDGINVTPVLVEGNASEEILKYAANNKIDMIIMSTHGRSGISRFFMGSVANRVLNHSLVPVLIVPPPGYRK